MRRGFAVGLFITIFTLGNSLAFGYYDSPNVVVNGVRLSPVQVQALQQLSCGPIPSGRYWLNVNAGVWGYELGPAQGRIGDRCFAGRSGSPADKWLGPGYNDRGPFGDAMSDGQCSFINGIPVGNCG